MLSERSPPVVRGKSTFSQRNSSAAISELHELRRLQLSGRPTDLRPSTSSRLESGRPLGGKKVHTLCVCVCVCACVRVCVCVMYSTPLSCQIRHLVVMLVVV